MSLCTYGSDLPKAHSNHTLLQKICSAQSHIYSLLPQLHSSLAKYCPLLPNVTLPINICSKHLSSPVPNIVSVPDPYIHRFIHSFLSQPFKHHCAFAFISLFQPQISALSHLTRSLLPQQSKFQDLSFNPPPPPIYCSVLPEVRPSPRGTAGAGGLHT